MTGIRELEMQHRDPVQATASAGVGVWLVAVAVLAGVMLAPQTSFAQRAASARDSSGAMRAERESLPLEALVLGARETHVRLVIPKDPVLSAILSAGVPGMGQLYVGNWPRGLAFFGGVTASLVAVGLAGDELNLDAIDYDAPSRGGNGDAIIDPAEYDRWARDPYGDFGDLSTMRKAAVIGGLSAALGLYAWNVVDAYGVANDHNRRLYSRLSGMRVSIGVAPDGRARAGISLNL